MVPRLALLILVASISTCFSEHKDLCDDYYCANGGECILIKLKNGHGWNGKHFQPTCQCAGSWTGERCDDNPCQDVNCNSGTCFFDENGSANCCCPSETTGEFCEIEALAANDDPCISVNCNNGTCIVGDDQSTRCACPVGTGGQYCEQHDSCLEPNFCATNAECINGLVSLRAGFCVNGRACCRG